MTSSYCHSWLGPRRGPLQLVWVYLGPWPANLGGSILGHLLFGHFLPQKMAILDFKPPFLSIFWPKTADFEKRPSTHGRTFRATLDKNGCEVDFGRSGKEAMSSNRQAFQAQLAPLTPQEAQETPSRPPQEFWKNLFFFLIVGPGLPATCSPPPAGASRPRVGSR